MLKLMDKIFIKDLDLMMSIGIYEYEKKAKQRVLVDIELFIDPPSKGWKGDDLAKSVSYEEIVNIVKLLSQDRHFNLVESFAEEIAGLCLAHKNVSAIKLCVQKPAAISNTSSVGVEITRKQ